MKWDREDLHLIDGGEVEGGHKYTVYVGPKNERGEWTDVGHIIINDRWKSVDGCLTFNAKVQDKQAMKRRLAIGKSLGEQRAFRRCIEIMCPNHCSKGEKPDVYEWRDRGDFAFDGFFHNGEPCPAAPIYRDQGTTA